MASHILMNLDLCGGLIMLAVVFVVVLINGGL